jgi:acyl-CoA synthetase (AMP-forming)/AMP-acid ligase II
MDKIWLKNYPANVKHEIDPNEYASLTDLLNQAFQKHGDSPFSVCMERWMSYKELDQLSQALGAWFQSQGLKPGARIAIMLPNVPQFAVTMAAILRAG